MAVAQPEIEPSSRSPMHSKWTDNRITTVQEREQSMGNDTLTRIVGGSPLGVLVRLVLLSIVVGFILREAHIDPQDILRSLETVIRRLWEMGLEPLRWLWQYFVLGAVVVIPVWLLIRLTRGLAGK
jgi:hypothetical protein